ncbi:uncharacterized protein LOC144422983 [Styela clava]
MENTTASKFLNARVLVGGKNPFEKYLKTLSTTTTTLPTTTTTTQEMEEDITGVEGRVLVPEVEVYVTKNTNVNVGNGSSAPEYEYGLCSPYPACNPIGCNNGNIAPIDCLQCNKPAVGATIFGMFFLSLFIIIANFLVIRVILQTPSLRRRHGFIKLSLATSDLLVGLFVLPSGIANLMTSLYYPYTSQSSDDAEYSFIDHVNHLTQKNSTRSVVFGTITIVSVISSLYNLLLLSVDRFLAIARPLKHRSGEYFSKKRLFITIGAAWAIGVCLAIIPGFFPDHFAYEMDVTTFFYIQRVETGVNGVQNHKFWPYYITLIIGGPYFLTVLLNLMTTIYTWKRLQTRRRLSSRRNMSKSAIEKKCERNKRIQMLKKAYPEAMIDEDDTGSSSKGFRNIFNKGTPRHQAKQEHGTHKEKESWLTWWHSDDKKANTSASNNVSTESEASQQSSQSPRFQRTRDQLHIVRDILNPTKARNRAKEFTAKYKSHVRVLKIIIAMVLGFTMCLLPYVIVLLKISDKSLTCNNMAVPFTFAMYLLFVNSGLNFIIYNLWHPEFRYNLIKMFRNDFSRTNGFRRAASSFFTTSQKGPESSMTYGTKASNSVEEVEHDS